MISVDSIAEICHEANRIYCQSIGDQSQKCWNDAEPWQRESAIIGVKFARANPDATPEDQHVAWSVKKLEDGWKHGSVKDTAAKTHPCLVPYNELPETQRRKDALFQAVVRALS